MPFHEPEPPENVEETLNAVAQRYAYIHAEHATEVMFLLDRYHTQERGEPLTDATYQKALSSVRGGRGETVSSQRIYDTYQDFLEDGESEDIRGAELDRGLNLAKTKPATVLTAPPEDAPTDEYVESYTDEVFDDIVGSEAGQNVQDLLYDQKDFRNTVLTKPIEP